MNVSLGIVYLGLADALRNPDNYAYYALGMYLYFQTWSLSLFPYCLFRTDQSRLNPSDFLLTHIVSSCVHRFDVGVFCLQWSTRFLPEPISRT